MADLLTLYRELMNSFGLEGFVSQAGLLVFGLFTLFKGLKFVQEGERGLIVRFGKVRRTKDGEPKIIEPGFIILLPYVDSLRKRHVRQQPIPLDEQVVTLKSGLSFRVAGVMYVRVKDIYKALFDITELDLSLKELGMGALRDSVGDHNDHQDLADTKKIAEKLRDDIGDQTNEWGVKTALFRITVCAPTSESAVIVNLEAAAKAKQKAIDAAANTLGMEVSELVECGYAAVIAGVPLVASASGTSNFRKHRELPKPPKSEIEVTVNKAT